jgi:hypothetical protein
MGSIIAFFIRTIILNPTVILGIVIAGYYKFNYQPEVVKLIFTSAWIPYAIMVGAALLYALFFKHIYYPNSKRINWWATIKSSIGHLFVIALSTALTFVVLYAWDYAFTRELDNYLRYKKQ